MSWARQRRAGASVVFDRSGGHEAAAGEDAGAQIADPGVDDRLEAGEARLGARLWLGADSSSVFADRLPVYVKAQPRGPSHGETQLTASSARW